MDTSLSSEDFFYIPLIADEETVFDLYYKGDKLHIEWKKGPDFLIGYSDDWNIVFGEALSGFSLSTVRFDRYDLDTIKRFIADPKEYIPYSIKYDLGSRLKHLEKSNKIPKNVFDKYAYEVRLLRIPQFIRFSGDIWDLYETYTIFQEVATGVKNELDTATYLPPNPDISYWVFLKEFNLNDPLYLHTEKLFYIIQMLLKNETLSIPPIEENSIDEWLKQTKSIMAELVGFNDGIFYDILVCNAYSRQFINKQQPLSDNQIKNIKNYWYRRLGRCF